MPIRDVPYQVRTTTDTSETTYSSTYAYDPHPARAKLIDKLRFYFNAIKWLWLHREEPNNRHKMRRMMREVQE